MKSIAPLKSTVVKTIQYPSDDGDEGLVTVAWRGPNINVSNILITLFSKLLSPIVWL